MTARIGIAALALWVTASAEPPKPANQDWTHYVRIAGHSLSREAPDRIIREATDSYVFGIETDNDITGRYESLLDPGEKLEAIRAVAKKAHDAGNYAFVYIAGLECITANAPKTTHTFAKDHPDWLQRKRTGEPAIFTGGSAFWIKEGDEDVWISPYAMEWRKLYMQRVRQIAETGIDGIYVDIPYWMTHFDGWEDSWASFDDYTVAAFKHETGLDARTDMKPGDVSDAGFRKWIDFRIATLTEFMSEIDRNAKAGNPNCKTIAEIYPGIEEEVVRVGSDVYQMYDVVDVIAHEYEHGKGDHMAASRTPLEWFDYLTGVFSFRSFAGGKPSWMLNYSWDGARTIPPAGPMKNLAMAEVMAGANFWDARGHVMSGSNDIAARKQIFRWIRDHEKTLYLPRQPVRPVGVYFSPQTRNYFPREFMASYKGVLLLLMQSHIEFQVVTPRNLASFQGKVLILPDARCLGKDEAALLENYSRSGKALVATGETGKYDASGKAMETNPATAIIGNRAGSKPGSLVLRDCPGKVYIAELERSFDRAASTGEGLGTFEAVREKLAGRLLAGTAYEPAVRITASPFVAAQIATVGGHPHVFLANFHGLKANQVADQVPERNARIVFPADPSSKAFLLPFLGEAVQLRAAFRNGTLSCTLPDIAKGAVVWVE
jgi:hypothetical protein